ncbi:RHS repeat-associated core domain-containing protein [Micromonospora carbonacea]|uniref:Intein C-terminal splicing region/intein N-terminal splicing region/RHS repeat-associated core domain-containing protein n=1 Tax=Micromonospora carbonacea TaxID=47853 RepID=A0A1C5AWM6_9ACTN|nr:RHS repeat-associated core domain-containing protein [Micromonospora carbonacea]SCF49464.1 intein C-terminal splicing region/intein N-terminal splicing region/RHS repeat-associated core domain-containing protein [Micromonospora carbonacea]
MLDLTSLVMRSNPAARRQTRITKLRVLLCGVAATSLVSSAMVVGEPAQAKPTPHLAAQTSTTNNHGGHAKGNAWPHTIQQRDALPAPKWPAPATASAALPEPNARTAGPVRLGQLPVQVARSSDPAGEAVSSVTVQILDRATIPASLRDGLLMRVTGATAGKPSRAALSVDYTSFRNAHGGDWASRLKLWQVPACALTDGPKPGCGITALQSSNDTTAGTVTAEVPVTAASSAAATDTLIALSAGSSGPSGDFGATPLQASSTWSAGGSAGSFSWSQPIRVPPAIGGLAPSINVSYSSASVDGRSSVTNNQPSWIGEGFDYWPGYIERRYVPCLDDMAGSANNTVKTGDLCWRSDNAMMYLNGQGVELVYEDGLGWHPREEDGSLIKKETGASNGDNNGEYWKVTTSDGIQYYFGQHNLPGQSSATNSTWTVPVAGNHTGEPCRQSTFTSSFCDQAWRWNLDYVIDTRGNTLSYWYNKETNKYARNIDDDDASYVRGGTLVRADYGTWDRGAADRSVTPTAQVLFTTADRCLTSCSVDANWLDTPKDQECDGTSCPGKYSPTFWSTKRLTKITTRVWDTTKTTPDWQNVDAWTFTQSFPSTGDGSDHDGLWLEKITQEGLVGATVTMPPVTFTPVSMPNRVLTSNNTSNNWQRIDYLVTETGAKIDIEYSLPECTASNLPSSPQSNDKRCYPARVIDPDDPEGEALVNEWWHKYVVKAISESDVQLSNGAAPPRFTYYEYVGTPAWHYSDDDGLTKPNRKTWNQFRGYATVKTRVGDVPGAQTLTETHYLRGMHGDRLTATTTRTVTVPASLGTETVYDEDQFTGMVREQIVYNGTDTKPVSKKVNVPWRSPATASRTINGDTVTARFVRTQKTYNATALGVDGNRGWRTTSSQTWFSDTYGTIDKTQDNGLDTAGDEKCETRTYNRNVGANLITAVKRSTVTALPCATAPTSTAHIISDTRNYYDAATSPDTAPTTGGITKVEQLKDWTAGSGTTWQTTTQNTFDAFGRLTSSTDIKGNVVNTSYTPASGGPVTGTTTTRPAPYNWTSTTVLNPYWGSTTKVTDFNGLVTDVAYDGLGRVWRVWTSGWDKTGHENNPSVEYTYHFAPNRDAYPYTASTALNAAGGHRTTYQLFDGFLRPRQTQTAGALPNATLVDDTIYDKLGRADTRYNTHVEAGTPSGALWWKPEWAVPSLVRTIYDNANRATAEIFLHGDGVTNLVEKWRATTTHEGDLTTVTPPDGGTPTTTVVDAQGRTVELREHTTSQGVTGPYQSTWYTYNGKDQLTTIADHAGNTWTYTFDVKGRQTSAKDPDKGTSTSQYNDYNELEKTTDARGEVLWYVYDALGRKTELRDDSATGALRAKWKYDQLYTGSTAKAKNQLTESYRYDPPGSTNIYKWQVGAFNPRGQPSTTNYVIPAVEGTGLAGTWAYGHGYSPYDGTPTYTGYPNKPNSSTINTGLPNEQVETVYNATTGLPTSLTSTSAGTYVTLQTYTEFGEPNITTRQTSGGLYVEDATYYDDVTRRANRITIQPQTAAGTVSDRRYTPDDAGNITTITDTPAIGSSETQCFRYDTLRRLTSAWTPAGSIPCSTNPTTANLGGPAPYWLDWTFDAVGNRTQEVSHGALANTQRVYTHPTGGPNVARPHATTKVTTTVGGNPAVITNYSYDEAGNTTCRPVGTAANTCPPDAQSQNLAWDAEGHLATISGNAPTAGSNIYDADGNRLLRRDATGTTLYLPGQEIRRENSTTVNGTRYYTFGGQLIASRNPTGLTWTYTDHQGTQLTAINATTHAVTTRRQEPYGQPRGSTPSWPNARGFVGGDQDPTGLTHLGAREYDPTLGRFISVDPVQDLVNPQQWHGYSYADNSPVTLSDPSGLRACSDDNCSGGADYEDLYGDYVEIPGENDGCGGCSETYQPSGVVRAEVLANHLATPVPGGIPEYVVSSGYRDADGVFTWGDAYEWAAQDPAHGSYACYRMLGLSEASCNSISWKRNSGGLAGLVAVALVAGTAACAVAGPECWVAAGVALRAVGPALTRLAASPGGRAATNAAAGAGEFAATGSWLGGAGVGTLGYGVAAGALCSFGGDTPVLLADGETKPISELKVGDRLEAQDPETGEVSQEPVTNVWVHEDKLHQLDVAGASLTTTEDHPYWNATDREWQPASALYSGDLLLTPSGREVPTRGLKRGEVSNGPAYNLTVARLHTYYVLAGDTPVLVHNSNRLCGTTALNNGNWQHIVDRHRPGGALVTNDAGVFIGKAKNVRQRIAEAINRGTPRANTPDPATGAPRPGQVYEWDFGVPVGRAGPANGGGELTRIRVIVNDGKVVTAFPF